MVSKDCQEPESNSAIDRELAQRFCDAYDEDGVDRSLIRFCLSLSPTERVKSVEETLNALATVRRVEPAR
jgi:hypothetical protein